MGALVNLGGVDEKESLRRGEGEYALDAGFEELGEGGICKRLNLPTRVDIGGSFRCLPRGELDRDAPAEIFSDSNRCEMEPIGAASRALVGEVRFESSDFRDGIGFPARALSISSPTLKTCRRSARYVSKSRISLRKTST